MAGLGSRLRGAVSEFDEMVGLGRVVATDGRTYRFHCTQIADGSRRIEVGATVRFALAAGRHGQWEAADLSHI